MDSSEAKKRLRKQILAARDRLEPDARRTFSALACERVRRAIDPAVKVLAVYAAYRGELDPAALEDGFDTVYPRIEGDDLVFARGRRSTMKPGSFGILEPTGPAVDLAAIDAFIVPGVAFTSAGDRLGYGRGFYDRALAGARGSKLGFAYDVQIVETLPTDTTDVPVDRVVTPTAVLTGRAVSG